MAKRRHNKTGRSDKDARHLRLYEWMRASSAWKKLDVTAKALYVEIKGAYDGHNNGRIGYSIREAEQALHIGKSTAARAFERLERAGFIVSTTKGSFSRKVRHATEWRLTEHACDLTGEVATKDFMRPRSVPVVGQQENQNTVPPQPPTVSVAGPIGTHSGTMDLKKRPDGTCSGTVEADFDPSSVPVAGHI